jgi:hypothetical protein
MAKHECEPSFQCVEPRFTTVFSTLRSKCSPGKAIVGLLSRIDNDGRKCVKFKRRKKPCNTMAFFSAAEGKTHRRVEIQTLIISRHFQSVGRISVIAILFSAHELCLLNRVPLIMVCFTSHRPLSLVVSLIEIQDVI